jgi:hypothetical protein
MEASALTIRIDTGSGGPAAVWLEHEQNDQQVIGQT